MKKTEVIHKGVKLDGTFYKGLGAVHTEAGIREGNGCDLPECHCSDGHWMFVSFGLKDKTIKGISYKFANQKEMNTFKKSKEFKELEKQISNG